MTRREVKSALKSAIGLALKLETALVMQLAIKKDWEKVTRWEVQSAACLGEESACWRVKDLE